MKVKVIQRGKAKAVVAKAKSSKRKVGAIKNTEFKQDVFVESQKVSEEEVCFKDLTCDLVDRVDVVNRWVKKINQALFGVVLETDKTINQDACIKDQSKYMASSLDDTVRVLEEIGEELDL